MIQFTVACLLLLVAYRNRRSFVQWITALHKNVQKIKPAVPSLLKLPGSSRGDDADASGNDGPQGLQPETSSDVVAREQQQPLDYPDSSSKNDIAVDESRLQEVSLTQKTFSRATYGSPTADQKNNAARTAVLTTIGNFADELTEDNEFGEEFLEKFSDSDRDSGVSDDNMLHFSASEDEILWRGRVREVKSVFEEVAAANSGNDTSSLLSGETNNNGYTNGRFRNLSDAEVMQLKSFLKDKDVKIIDSSGRESELSTHKCERPSFLPLAGMQYYRRNMSSKSSISDDLDSTLGEEKLSPAADVVCWSGPYKEQEQEQRVLRRMSNPFLIKRRVTSKLDTVDRLEKRIQEQQDRINHLLDQIQEKRAAEDFGSTDMEYGTDEQEAANSEPEMNGNGDTEEECAEDLELQLVEERSILRRYQKSLKETLEEIAALSAKIDWGINGGENGGICSENGKEIQSKNPNCVKEMEQESRSNSTAMSNHRD